MAWIELHQELAQHRKLDRLIKDTGLGRDAALGRLCLLWLWALQNRPDGDLSDLDAKRAAEIFGVTPRKAAPFLEALERCGFLDRAGESLRIHDWEDYTGRYSEIRRRNAERKRRSREKQRDKTVTVTGLQDQTGPDRTGPDQTGQDLSFLSGGDGARAEAAAMEEYLLGRGLKPEDWLGATDTLLARSEALARSLFTAFCSREPTRADCARVLPLVTVPAPGDPAALRWDEDREALLRYAFEQANRNGKAGVWGYIEAVLLRLHQRGIRDLRAAEDYDLGRENSEFGMRNAEFGMKE